MDRQVTVTTLNRKWVLKMSIFVFCLIGLGVWGALDAFVIYPAKGKKHAEFMLKDYLSALDERGLLLREASVADPESAYASLRGRRDITEDSVESARRAWLESLSRVHSLAALSRENQAELDRRGADPGAARSTTTMFTDPRATLGEVTAKLATESQPSALRAYDIPLQYVFIVLGIGGGVWLLLFVLACGRKRFRFDHDAMRLTLPGGRSFTPEQISAVDKRDWHKYYIHLTVEGFEKELRLDLLRFSPLEDWVLEMEKRHPNYEPPAAEPEPSASEEAKAEEESVRAD